MRVKILLFLACFSLVLSSYDGGVRYLTAVALAQEPALAVNDCGKCHSTVARDIETAGMAHKTSVNCLDCHDGHPPDQLEIIPACSLCHPRLQSAHYGIEGCLSCHKNPHRPLEITLGKNLTTPCLTCHANQGQQLKDFPSYHSTLACTACHERQHGHVPSCSDCHKPHGPEIAENACGKCHQAHKPLAVAFAGTLAAGNCAGCHGPVVAVLNNSQAKHKKLDCLTCHGAEHKSIPACGQCHQPHSPDMAADRCRNCHQAHSPSPAVFGEMVASTDCGACHEGVFKALSASQTRHQGVSCVECHAATHGSIPQCAQCHQPHSKEMVQADCVACHAAHKPMPVVYGEKVASKNCAGCHSEAYRLLQASKSRHHDLTCAGCHPKHKVIPACLECHDSQHPPAMLKQFPDCKDCHNIAHDLLM